MEDSKKQEIPLGAGRKVGIAVFGVAMLLFAFSAFDVTLLNLAYSFAVATALFCIFLVQHRKKPITIERGGPGTYIVGTLRYTLYGVVFVLAVFAVVAIRPELLASAMNYSWSVLGVALYLCMVFLYVIFRTP